MAQHSSRDRLRFGLFLPPIHRIGRSPHRALRRDVALAQVLDDLGFDEMWIGEHHSGGAELIASPELFIAHAAALTRGIKFGTGVISLPYHHPFHVADRLVMLDHLTEGRVIFGAGPGQLARDARMIGKEPGDLRPQMEEAFDVIVRLLRGETVTSKTDWYTCDEAVLQIAPYTDIEICVTGTVSPSGPKLAGRYGAGLLSLVATDPAGSDKLAAHWEIMEHESAVHGTSVSRDAWRLVGPMHIAPTVEQAKAECRYNIKWTYDYLTHVSPMTFVPPDDPDELCDYLNESGRGVIGTPEMAIAQIERMQQLSGGFGCYLTLGLELGDWGATQRSLELFADEVIPHFTGQLEPIKDSAGALYQSSKTDVQLTREAQLAATARYQAQRSAEGA